MSKIANSKKNSYYYFFLCYLNVCGKYSYYSLNTFKISFTSCEKPPIIYSNINSSYSFQIESIFKNIQVLKNYSRSQTDCSYNYSLHFSNGTLYTKKFPLTLDNSSGILSIPNNIELNVKFSIVVSTVNLTLPLTSTTS